MSGRLAHATAYYWDTNGAAGFGAIGPFTWDGSNAFWNTDSTGATSGTFIASPTNADDLSVNGGTTGTITLSGTQVASSLTFAVNVAKTLSGGTSLTIGGSGTRSGIFVNSGDNAANTVSSPLILNSASTALNFSNAGAGLLTVGAITGAATTGTQTLNIGSTSSGGITLNGIIGNGGAGGNVALTINNTSTGVTSLTGTGSTYSGATTISAGILDATSFAAINTNSSIGKGSMAGSAADLVLNGGTLRKSSASVSTTDRLFSVGTSGGTIDSSAVLAANTLSFTGTGAMGFNGQTGTRTLLLTGTNTGNNTIALAIGNDGSSNATSLTKTGAGTWVLSGTNTYTGTTRVDGGTLQFINQVSLYNNGAAATWSNTNISVGSGATMAFNVGGAGQFTETNINTLLGLSDATTNGFNAGSRLGLDTTGTVVFTNAIANPNGGNNRLSVIKLGGGTLRLEGNNTYTGGTFIGAGILRLGDGTANGGTTGKLSTSSVIVNNGTLTINRSNAVAQGTDFSAAPIAGTGALIQSGSGTTTLNAANTFSGTTTVSGGVLNLTNSLALQNSALVTTGAGTVTLTGPTTLTVGGLSGATGDLSSIITSGYTGTVTALTLNPLSGSVTYGGAIANTTMTLTKTGAGTQILTGTNLYTGTTFLNAGTLTLGDGTSAGSLSSSSAISLSGGTLSIKGNTTGTTNQTLGNVTVNSGGGQILGDRNGATLNIALGSITATATGGSLVIGAGGTLANLPTSLTTTTDKDATTGIYGGRVTFFNGTAGTGYDWATTASVASPYTLSAYAGYSAMAASGTDTLNTLVTGSATPLSGNLTTNSLKFAVAANNQTLNLGGNTLTLTSGGLLITGAARDTTVISNGTITAGSGSSPSDLVVHQYNTVNNLTNSGGTAFARNTTISAAINDNGVSNPVTLVNPDYSLDLL